MSRILRVFINVDMRNGHVGLAALGRLHKVNVAKLEPGEHVVFVNAARNRMKVYSANDVLSYVARGERISLDAIKYIPLAWEGKQRFDYDKALAMAVDESLKKGTRKQLIVH